MSKIKGFVTYKCTKCFNVMRDEYNPRARSLKEHEPCRVCGSRTNWKKIKMNEV